MTEVGLARHKDHGKGQISNTPFYSILVDIILKGWPILSLTMGPLSSMYNAEKSD